VTKSACVLGGGLVGLKAAYALKKRKIDVKVIIKSKQVLSQMLDSEAAAMVAKRLEENGIELVFGEDVTEVIGEGEIKAVKLDSGKAIGCSMIIVGKGVDPNIDLVKETEIKVSEGIVCDNLMQASVPNIFTAGDACESFDLTLGKHAVNALWTVAVEQGRVAGANMAGEKTAYDGSLGMNSIEFFGLPVISLGVYKVKEDSGCQEIKMQDAKANRYKKLIIKDNTLIGAVLAGDIKNSGVFLRLIRERVKVSSIQDRLLSENFGYPDIMDLVREKEQLYV
jgi:NAD(P)H-nitrite reductase large subunit